MKVLSAEQMRQLDAYTISHEPVDSIDLMERAAQCCTDWLNDHFDLPFRFVILCGPGNNGGDGLAIARQLAESSREVLVFAATDKGTEDNRVNYQRLKDIGVSPQPLESFSAEVISDHEIIVDALFGYGLSRPLEGKFASMAELVNELAVVVVGIDMPSGLYADAPSPGIAVKCDFTLSFQTPKLAFFIPENQNAVGEWIILNINLDPGYLFSLESGYSTMEPEEVSASLPVRHKFDHKGTFGHALLVAGSFGKVGAAILAAQASLRSGVGLLTVHVPRQATSIMHIAVPEAMVSSDRHDYNFSGIDNAPEVSAIGIGCGLGLHGCTTSGIRDLLKTAEVPLVIDADGLNTISANPELLGLLPKGTILTPHLKEFARLFGESDDHFERLGLLKRKAVEHGLVIVLKGAHSAVAGPDGRITFNTTGNPGMATPGSGDALTGIISGLLAQGLEPANAARAGVYLHGLAGDLAAETLGNEALLASDLVAHIGKAFQFVRSL